MKMIVSAGFATCYGVLLLIFLHTGFASAAQDIAPAESTDPAELPNVVPSKLENADSAFAKLDVGKKGYLTDTDTRVLTGFEPVFQAHDKDSDGKLTPEEFMQSWEAFTGIPSKPENFQRTK
jgi:Ca2+-binding EF-hand superfamily protein